MSQFIDAVKTELLMKRKPNLFPMLSAEMKYADSRTYDTLREYQVSVEWKQTGYCKDSDLNQIQKNAIRALREAIYGDISHRIIRLERAVYEQDRDAVLSEIRDIMREVFG